MTKTQLDSLRGAAIESFLKFDDFLDSHHDSVKLGDITISASAALRAVDPAAYYLCYFDWLGNREQSLSIWEQ